MKEWVPILGTLILATLLQYSIYIKLTSCNLKALRFSCIIQKRRSYHRPKTDWFASENLSFYASNVHNIAAHSKSCVSLEKSPWNFHRPEIETKAASQPSSSVRLRSNGLFAMDFNPTTFQTFKTLLKIAYTKFSAHNCIYCIEDKYW